jgi:hypothetical protein
MWLVRFVLGTGDENLVQLKLRKCLLRNPTTQNVSDRYCIPSTTYQEANQAEFGGLIVLLELTETLLMPHLCTVA